MPNNHFALAKSLSCAVEILTPVVDTLDLQDHHAPSAKDHSKHSFNTSSGLAPHQEHSVRHAEQDARNQMIHGPDLDESHLNADRYHDGMDIHDDMDAGLGHHGREEGDLADEESDDLLDDDLLDKISSSPSIDDGKHQAIGL